MFSRKFKVSYDKYLQKREWCMFSRKLQVIYDKYLQKGSGICVLES